MAMGREREPIEETLSAYERTLEWLYGLHATKGMDFKLDRMVQVLAELNDPHRTFPVLHVAGTNGKGSVAATLHSILTHAGYRVGLYVSPHLIRFTERIRIGSNEVSPATVVELAGEVRAAAEEAGVQPTFFELVTLMAFLHFARFRVDVAVIEAGLGGRLDATNVVDPAATVITTIGRDHTEFLGDSIRSIAAEKAGVIKTGRPVIVGRVDEEAARVIEEIASQRTSPVYRLGRDYDWSAAEGFCFAGMGQSWERLSLALRGRHQGDNAATALATLVATAADFPISEQAIRQGLASVQWPGRLQVVAGTPTVILDSAHNPDGMRALRQELPRLVGQRQLHALFAVMRDKEWQVMVQEVAPLCTSAIATEVMTPRCLAASDLAAQFAQYCPTSCRPHLADAWREVCEKAGSTGIVLVTGSLFLVGAVSEILADRLGTPRSAVETARP